MRKCEKMFVGVTNVACLKLVLHMLYVFRQSNILLGFFRFDSKSIYVRTSLDFI